MQNSIYDAAINEIFIQLGIDKSRISLEYTINSERNGLSVRKNGDAVSVVCSEPVYLFRALGILKEHINEDTFSLSENARFSLNGTMLDCSRGAVLTVDTVKEIIRQHALMGLNTIMLYTEDTYEIDSEPYFGYMRGRYTLKELQEIDNYAARFGITMVPCIQTLAHLGNVLRWNTYSDITDTAGILLVDDERVYELIEKMLITCRAAFRSKRIHIGMDEAHFLGRGKYYDLHGDCDKAELYLRHLDRVTKLCEKYEFRPMIWGDMPFRIAGYRNYTDSNDPIDPNRINACIPETVDVIYWDYYSTTPERYAEFIHAHKKISKTVIFSGGAWRWANFAPNLTHSLQSSREALSQCVKYDINEVFVTLWGDGGSESSVFSCWPAVQLYAEYNFYDNVSDEHLASRFKVCTGGNLSDFMKLELPNYPMGIQNGKEDNPAKYLFYQDPMLGLFDCHVCKGFGEYYKNLAKELWECVERAGKYADLFKTIASLCDVLADKAELGIRIKSYYEERNLDALRLLADKDIPRIIDNTKGFLQNLSVQWHQENKSFGFAVLNDRFGGVIQRLSFAADRLRGFADGKLNRLEELETQRLPYVNPNNQGRNTVYIFGAMPLN